MSTSMISSVASRPGATLLTAALLVVSLAVTSGRAPAAARQADPVAQPPVQRPAAEVPLFVGPATLDLSGRAGHHAWEELRFGSDRVRLGLRARAGTSPCGLYLAMQDWLPWSTSETKQAALPISSLLTVGPGDVGQSASTELVDYATASLRVLSTCPRWWLDVEPLTDPDLAIEVTEDYYPVRGRTIRELASQADQAEDGWTAFTDWRTEWRYQWLDSGTSCELTGGEVDVTARITYPRWRPPDDAAPSVVARWERFMANLVTHELGHVTIALQGAEAIDDHFDSGSSEATCSELERATDEAAKQLHDRYERLNVRYDRVTGHGLAQGTGLP
jgi:predicted secreted Zn-dependent protease